MNKDEVQSAFEILLEEIERILEDINDAGARAFQRGAYDEARQISERAKWLAEFHDRVKALQQEWASHFPGHIPREGTPHRGFGRLRRGIQTPEKAFRRPILEALVALGGRGRMSEVLDLVEKKMKGVLTDYDYQSLPSRLGTPRWRNTAQWCRLKMVREGLLKNDSPPGIWEISEKGREALRGGEI